MKRKFNFTIPPRYIFAILSFICIIFILISFKFSDSVAPFKTLVGRVMSPMQNGINEVGSYIHSKTELLNSVKELTKENEKLKEKLNEVQTENKQLLQDKYDLATLRDLFKLKEQYNQYEMTAARVTSREPSNWYSTITINKGAREGFKEDMNVIADGGLVGIITEVGWNYSVVRLIVDDNSNVTGSSLTTGDTCNVHGNLELLNNGLIELNTIKNDAQIAVGDEIVTSQTSSKFLPGILIGYVDSIKMDNNNLTQSGYIRPQVDFSHLETVLVITQLKEQQQKTAPDDAKQGEDADQKGGDQAASPSPSAKPTATPSSTPKAD